MTGAIENHLLERLLIADFKKRKLDDIRVHNFADVSTFEIKNFDHVVKMMMLRDPRII